MMINVLPKFLNRADLKLQYRLIEAIALVNSPRSITILMNYYEKHKSEFNVNSTLALAFVNAINNLCQSKAYSILLDLYIHHHDFLIRWTIIKALESAGGPKSKLVLKTIYIQEPNKILKKDILRQINKMSVTTI